MIPILRAIKHEVDKALELSILSFSSPRLLMQAPGILWAASSTFRSFAAAATGDVSTQQTSKPTTHLPV